MSDPRPPDDGPSWPERDLDEDRAEEPATGWSDDPYRSEPLPPNRPSDEPLEGEWSDSQPFESEPPEPDPFAPDTTPRLDDPWGFPPRSQPIPEPTYEPAPTEPEFESTPSWGSDAWSEPEPQTPEPSPQPEYPAEAEPVAAEETSGAEPQEAEPEPMTEPAPVDELTDDEQEWIPPGESAAEAEGPPQADAEPIYAGAAEPEAELISEGEPDRSDAFVAAALASEAAVDVGEANQAGSDETSSWEHASASEPQAEPAAAEAPEAPVEPLPEPEPPPEPVFEPEYEPSGDVAIEAAVASTAFGETGEDWDPKRDGNRRRPTTAEQAVPWLIGIILALAGMVIVLLALIFSSPNGLVAGQPSPSPSVQPSGSAVAIDPSAQASGSGAASASASAEPPPATPTPAQPSYGPLEMTYLGRPSAVAPVYLLLRDFSVEQDPDILAQAQQGVSSYAGSPDGRVAAAVIDKRAVALDKGGKTRRLADNITTVTFGWDPDTLYAVRITRDGGDDLAKILEITFASGHTRQLTTVRYKHPDTGAEAPLREAQFIDNGGLVRLYAVADGNLTLWVLGAPATYRIDPANGEVTKIGRQPILWSPDGTRRVTVHEDGNRTALRLRDRGNQVIASVGVTGLVSHIRWAGTNNEIVFTLGVATTGGGIRQDLYVWNLDNDSDAMPLTSTGAAFGAEWRGVMSNWGP